VNENVLERDGLSAVDSACGKLQRVALGWLEGKADRDEIPTSLRFLFYELEQAGHVSKRAVNQDGTDSKRKPDQNLIEAVTVLREAGLVPWDWIVDESRDVDAWEFAPSVAAYLRQATYRASLDRFPGVVRPVILCESRGVGGVLSRGVTGDYLVTVAPTGGQCAGFLHTKVARYLRGEGTRVLYVGDHDLAGNDIEENTRSVLERATGRTFTADTWERLMLTDEQCRRLRKQGVKPIRKKDKRFKDGKPHEAFEVEALGQALVNQTVRDRLEELAPEPLEAVLEREVREREEAGRRLARWK
jgi:hypothetical protein